MDDKYLWIGAGVVALVIILWFILSASRRRKQKLLAKILSSYGTASQREYLPEDIRKIKKYYDTVKKDGEFTIDDITWNDLGMDHVFCQMNHTFSSPGEEELYRMLRTPVFSQEILDERDEKIRWLSENEIPRTELQLEFAGIGRTKKICLAEALKQFKDIKLQDNIGYILHLLLLIIAAVVTVFFPFVGIIALLGVMIFNIATYYKQKAEIETYYMALSCFSYIAKAGKRILALNTPIFAKENQELSEALKPLQVLKKDDYWLGAASGTQISANPMYLLLDYFRMMTHLDFIAFNHMVKTIQNSEESILKVLQILGEMEALTAMASYRETIPFHTTGEFSEETVPFEIVDAYHPLVSNPVANSITTSKPVLLTGSNASGKSTFLRTVAINVLLAETVCTAHCHTLKMNFFRIYSSMALQDSVEAGESYYIVEIKSLKRILDQTAGEPRVLCFIDEVLRGTNTVERIAASSQILKLISQSGAMIFAATHDVELTNLLEDFYENKHFEEQVIDGQVIFDYILKDGRATTRNAIKLLSSLGYDETVTEKAEKQAKAFESEGTWSLF